MTTADLLARCGALGVTLLAGPGGALAWEADADPPADLLRDLAGHKAEILARLRQPPGPSLEPDVWDTGLLRLVEADLGLRAGSLRWIDLPGRRCPGCTWCQ
jgi:hypothetical protein